MITLNYTMNGAMVVPERELTAEEKLTVTEVVTNGSVNKIYYYQNDKPPKSTAEKFAEELRFRKSLVDEKTESLMVSGFSFEGKTLGLRENEKLKWLAISKTPAKLPMNLISKEGQLISVTALNVDTFYNTAFDRAAKIETDGGLLKYQMNQCTTIEQLNAIVDNRS